MENFGKIFPPEGLSLKLSLCHYRSMFPVYVVLLLHRLMLGIVFGNKLLVHYVRVIVRYFECVCVCELNLCLCVCVCSKTYMHICKPHK